MLTYLGTLVVGTELVQIATYGRTARYVSMNQSGSVQIVDERLDGTMPMRIAALRHLLAAMPPGMEAYAVHPGLGDEEFFLDVANAKDALVLEGMD